VAAAALVAAGCGGGGGASSSRSALRCSSSSGSVFWSGSTVWYARAGRVVSSRGASVSLPRGAAAVGFRACGAPAVVYSARGELRAQPLAAAGKPLLLVSFAGTTIRPAGGSPVALRGLQPKWQLTSVVASPHGASAFLAAAQSPEAGIELCGKGLGAVYRVTSSGTHTLLVDNPCRDTPQPAFSPDGSRISYLDSESNALYTLRANGTGRARVATSGKVVSYLWSPDGRRIAYESRSAGGTSVWVSTPGGATHRLAAGELAGWSPDGRVVAVVRGRSVLAVPVAGGSSHALLHL
jgi:WD40 repeat protein